MLKKKIVIGLTLCMPSFLANCKVWENGDSGISTADAPGQPQICEEIDCTGCYADIWEAEPLLSWMSVVNSECKGDELCESGKVDELCQALKCAGGNNGWALGVWISGSEKATTAAGTKQKMIALVEANAEDFSIAEGGGYSDYESIMNIGLTIPDGGTLGYREWRFKGKLDEVFGAQAKITRINVESGKPTWSIQFDPPIYREEINPSLESLRKVNGQVEIEEPPRNVADKGVSITLVPKEPTRWSYRALLIESFKLRRKLGKKACAITPEKKVEVFRSQTTIE